MTIALTRRTSVAHSTFAALERKGAGYHVNAATDAAMAIMQGALDASGGARREGHERHSLTDAQVGRYMRLDAGCLRDLAERLLARARTLEDVSRTWDASPADLTR